MKSYYFTFGSNHETADGMSLGNFYTIITAENYSDARKLMFDARSDKWSMQYDSAEEAGVSRFYLQEISLEEIRL